MPVIPNYIFNIYRTYDFGLVYLNSSDFNNFSIEPLDVVLIKNVRFQTLKYHGIILGLKGVKETLSLFLADHLFG